MAAQTLYIEKPADRPQTCLRAQTIGLRYKLNTSEGRQHLSGIIALSHYLRNISTTMANACKLYLMTSSNRAKTNKMSSLIRLKCTTPSLLATKLFLWKGRK